MVPSLIRHKKTLCYMSTMFRFHNCSDTMGWALLPWIITIKTKTININSSIPMGSGENEKLPPRRFPTVGIEREIRRTSTQLPSQTSSPWWSVCPPYGVDSMNLPNPTHGRPSEGVGRGQLGGIRLD